MGMLKEFKEFAMRGNVVDMAVGVIIGGAFGKIVTSLVNDVIMPPIGIMLGNVDFAKLTITLRKGIVADPAQGVAAIEPVMLRYGAFINTVLDFVIVAFCIFMAIKAMNSLHRKEEAPAKPTKKDCPKCCTSIPIAASRCPNCTSELQPA
jgi:large conductance mechanosensitive channel